MQKKLMAVAVAGALAMPGVAAAQSVTLSGFYKVGLENIKIGDPAAARAGAHDSETRVADNSSRLIFNMNEDMGGGLQAIAQLDVRFSPDNGALAGNGNDWVGIRSSQMGTMTLGRWDLHYGKSPSDLPSKAGALKAAAISVMDYMPTPASATTVGATTAIANATRTPNVVKWDSPNWSGFTATVAYSTNANTAGGNQSEADLTAPAAGTTAPRKGYATNLAAAYEAAAFKVEYSNWNSKPDASLADQKGDTINAWMRMGGLKFGVAYNMSSNKNAAGTLKAERTAYTIPVNFSTGAHDLHFHYTAAGKTKVEGNEVSGSDATMMAFAYVYNLSKRTSMGVTYAQIKNESTATYAFFTDGGNGNTGLSSTNAAPGAGEDPTLLAFIVRHAF